MSRNTSRAEALAMQAAKAIAAQADEPEPEVVTESPPPAPARPATPAAPAKRGRGRPRNRRPVEAKHTVYLDGPRQEALVRIAEDRGRSVHSLILEGIDHVIEKPRQPGWQPR